MDALQQRFDAWEAASEKLDWDESRNNVTGKYAAVRGSGGDLGSGPRDGVLPMGATGRGKDVAPLAITKKDAREAYEAVKRGQNYIIQAKDATTSFSTVDSLLVAQQAPGIVPEYFEARLIDHLPVTSISAPSYQFIQHQYANDSGGPGFTAEGTQKAPVGTGSAKGCRRGTEVGRVFQPVLGKHQRRPQWESYLINTGYQRMYQAETPPFSTGRSTMS
jgi:hypothetical protein